jgi:prophage tail gpP-like protein
MAEAGADQVELTIGGRVFGGWKSISIESDLDTLADSFELGVTERWAGQPDRWAIEAGAAAKVLIGGEVVIDGYVDVLESQFADSSHSITVSGRSRAADLIDCSAIAKPGSWRNRKIEAIAAELAKPFGITVTAKASTGAALKAFALQPGETVADALGRMLQMRGLLAISNPRGEIEIVTPDSGVQVARIEQGKQPLQITGHHTVRDRFSTYIVKGQAAGDDEANGKTVAAVKAEAKDPAVTRYRPMMIIAEDQADSASADKRAKWEATVRAGRAQGVEIILPGWRTADGKLWQRIDRVQLAAASAWIDDELMIVGVTFSLDDGGRRTELRLIRKEAYSPLAVPEKAEASKIRKRKKSS